MFGGMGSDRHFAQQSSGPNVRFGSKADIEGTFAQCPLYLRKQTFVSVIGVSAECHRRTFADRDVCRDPPRFIEPVVCFG
jgi:hypothetical protein